MINSKENSREEPLDFAEEEYLNESDLLAFTDLERNESDKFQKAMEESKHQGENALENPIERHFTNPSFVKEDDRIPFEKLVKAVKRIIFAQLTQELQIISGLVEKFLHHCATLIQTHFRIHRLKTKGKPILIMRGVLKGWKVRKILSVPAFIDWRNEILEIQVFFHDLLNEGDRSREYAKQVFNSLLQRKAQFSMKLREAYYSGSWVSLMHQGKSNQPIKKQKPVIKEEKPKEKIIVSKDSPVSVSISIPLTSQKKMNDSPKKEVSHINPKEVEEAEEDKGKHILVASESNISLNNEGRQKAAITNERLDWSQVGSRVNCWTNKEDSGTSARRQKASSKSISKVSSFIHSLLRKKTKLAELEKAYQGNYLSKLQALESQVNKSKISCITSIPYVKDDSDFSAKSGDKDFFVPIFSYSGTSQRA